MPCLMKSKVVIEKFRFKTVEHLPYTPDLAPTDYHIFRARKRDLITNRISFQTDSYKNKTRRRLIIILCVSNTFVILIILIS